MNKIILLIVFTIQAVAQEVPFNCDYSAYLFQHNDVYAIDLASGNSFEIATDITEANINAAAYNTSDGFIWGSLSAPAKTIVKIGKNFKTTSFYIDELPDSGCYVGDVALNGTYYLKGSGSSYYAINLNPESNNYVSYEATHKLSKNISIHDWAFNAVDNKLYAVEKKTNILYRINAETGEVKNLGEVPILSGLNYTYGAVYFDASGRFYVSANQTGTIYVIQSVQDLDASGVMESNLFAFGPSSSQNDGARCPTAPVLQEICDNGIDDDGDGLVDCEDPSCSGYTGCPILKSFSSSSANAGGLESNNRLSQQITKRNFNRAQTNYKFDNTKAKRFTKSLTYGKRNTGKNNAFQLSDLMPLGVIQEDVVVESSPKDLIGITNANAVYSVDYIRNEKTVASVLLLKTDKDVYEHTKYICDRLLGAELIAVSTIEINNQQFIKSLIRTIDGSLEFVLSLSAKLVNNGANFGIESHWNLDKYESGVGFYNFQIWSNSLDDLVKLGEEVVKLLDVQRPIISYNNSLPPTVFVRTGSYKKGKLNLEIVNTNRTESITFDGGLRRAETEDIDYITSSISLSPNYISKIEINTGHLFDIGFRIGDGVHTPDDLFMSDGPWGYDDAAPTTSVTNYSTALNDEDFNDDEYAVERNISLEATTSEYIAAYRALTPKFNPVNLAAYSSFQLKAKGTGKLIIRLVKESINNWETQYKTSIVLTDSLTNYNVLFSDFKSTNGLPLEVKDVTSIVFTMLSENGEKVTKKMILRQLRFSKNNVLAVAKNLTANEVKTTAIPNPMYSQTTIHFSAKNTETAQLLVYNKVGSLVKQLKINIKSGHNRIPLGLDGLTTGFYFCSIKSKYTNYKTLKLCIH